MGRGDRNTSANRSAQALLFGPRRGRKISPEAKKKHTVEKRKMTMQARQRGHQKRFLDGAQAFIDGDYQPLTEVLSEETPKGALGAEKEAIREIAKTLFRELPNMHYSGSYQAAQDRPLPGGEAALDAIQALRIRAIDRKLPSGKVLEPLTSIAGAQANLIVIDQFKDKVKTSASQFACIPKCIRIGHSWHVMDPEGKSLCRKDDQPRSEAFSLFNAGKIYCQDCLQGLIDKKPVATMSRAELEDEIDDIGLKSLTSNAISWNMPRPAMTARETVELGIDSCDRRLCKRLDTFLLSPPKAFIAKP